MGGHNEYKPYFIEYRVFHGVFRIAQQEMALLGKPADIV